MCREHSAPGCSHIRRRRVDNAAERLDHDPAVGLLVIGGPYLPDLALDPELRAGESEGSAPLTCAGLGGQAPDAGLRVVERLWHRRVRLVRAGRRYALVL